MTERVVVVGAGHNGLVAALQLARAGRRVTVLEQGTEPGGCLWSETHPTGVLVERGAYEHAGVRATALALGLDDPALGEAALAYVEHPVAVGVAFGDGQRRVFHADLERTVAGLGTDAVAYRRLVELADVLFGMLDAFPSPPTLTQVASALEGLTGGDQLFRLLLQPAEVVAATHLDDPYLRAAVELQASHAQVPAWAPGTGMFALLLPASHGSPPCRPVGGSRALTTALVAAFEAAGGSVRTHAEVVALRPGTAGGGEAVLADGEVVTADTVVSSIGLPRTSAALGETAPVMRRTGRSMHSGHFNVTELTVTLVTDRRVDLGLEDPDAVHYVVDSPGDVRTGFADVLAGRLPTAPWAMVSQVAQPEGVTGGAIWMSSVVPLRRGDGAWTAAREREAAERVVDHVSQVLGVDLRAHLVDLVVSGPATWRRRIGGDGSPNHVDTTIDQLMGWRPPGHAHGRTELDWLHLTGAGVHPGGGLSGASGLAAARSVLSAAGERPGPARRAAQEWQGLRRGVKAYLSMRKGL